MLLFVCLFEKNKEEKDEEEIEWNVFLIDLIDSISVVIEYRVKYIDIHIGEFIISHRNIID